MFNIPITFRVTRSELADNNSVHAWLQLMRTITVVGTASAYEGKSIHLTSEKNTKYFGTVVTKSEGKMFGGKSVGKKGQNGIDI